MAQQHELRVPSNWSGESRSLVIQLNQILKDLYRQIGNNKLAKEVEQLSGEMSAGFTRVDGVLDGLLWEEYTDHTVDTTKITAGTVRVWTNSMFCCIRIDAAKFYQIGMGQANLITGLPLAIETVDSFNGGDEAPMSNTVYVGRGETSLTAHIYSHNTDRHWFTLIYPINPLS